MSEQRCGDRLPIAHATLVCGRPRGHDGEHRCTRADGSMTGWNDVPAPAPLPVTTDVQRELAKELPHTMGCAAHRSATGRTRLAPCRCGHPGSGCSCYEERLAESESAGRCICFHDRVLPRLLPTVQALIADAEKRAAAGALRDLAADLSRCEDAPTDAALEGLDFTLRTLRDRAVALDPSGAAEGAGR